MFFTEVTKEIENGRQRNYDVIMKAQIIQIGNSQGLRIPKVLLEESGLSGEVDLEVREDGILIRRTAKPRGNWDAIFASLTDTDDDQALETKSATAFDSREWQW
jgi:antitoxin MazE